MNPSLSVFVVQRLFAALDRSFDAGPEGTGELSFDHRDLGLYVHFPFCDKVCRYCPFCRSSNARDMDAYMEALVLEVTSLRDRGLLEGSDVSSVAFGGGTPSLMPADGLRKLMATLRGLFPSFDGVQKTMECTPESLNPERLLLFDEVGFDRLSVGVQSLRSPVLEELGRPSDLTLIRDALELVASDWKGTWSADLIYGFESQRVEELVADALTLCDLGVHHLSLFPLVNQDARSRQTLNQRQFRRMEEMHGATSEALSQRGYDGYSVEDFSLNEDAKCRYQLDAWAVPQRDLLILGSGAFGVCRNARYDKVGNRKRYMSEVEAGKFPLERYRALSKARMRKVRALMGLHYNRTPNSDWLAFLPLRALGIAADRGDEVELTKKGRFVTSLLWAKLMLSRMTRA